MKLNHLDGCQFKIISYDLMSTRKDRGCPIGIYLSALWTMHCHKDVACLLGTWVKLQERGKCELQPLK